MKTLFIKNNTRDYISKIYWSLQKGLALKTDLVSFGKNQDFYDESATRYQDIIDTCYGKGFPDLVIADFDYAKLKFNYEDWGVLPRTIKRVMLLGDYWAIPNRLEFIDIVKRNFDFVLTFFYESIKMYPELGGKLIFCPPSIDPDIFRDWELNTQYEVGFLGSGCNTLKRTYPERFRITNLLKNVYGDAFYTDEHPGWGFFDSSHNIVGEGFSKAINKCKIFLTTSGTIGHCNPKYYEIMASGSLLFGNPCNYLSKYHIENLFNCIIFKSDKDLLNSLQKYLKHTSLRQNIINKGLDTIRRYHTGAKRAETLLGRINL